MTEVARRALDMAEARLLTDEVKNDAAALWGKLLALHDGQAHVALGYRSWAAYCAGEFEMGKSQAYRLLDAGRVAALLNARSPKGDPALPPVPSERVARELATADDPADAWETVVEVNGETPTATQTRDVVQQLKDPATAKQMSYLRSLAGRAGAELPDEPISKKKASRLIDHLADGHACECRHCGRQMTPA